MRLPVAQDPRDGEDDVLSKPQQQEGQLRSGRRAAGGVVSAAHLHSEEVVESEGDFLRSERGAGRDQVRYGGLLNCRPPRASRRRPDSSGRGSGDSGRRLPPRKRTNPEDEGPYWPP